MKNLILKFLFLFYKYYDKGSTKSIAYTSALIALIMVLFLNVFSILIFIGIEKKYLVFSDGVPIYIKYLIGFTLFILIFFILKRAFKKEDILKIEMDKPSMRNGYILIIAYIISSMFILTVIIQNT